MIISRINYDIRMLKYAVTDNISNINLNDMNDESDSYVVTECKI